MKPYEWGSPQFDPETHRAWFEAEEREPYVKRGLRFKPAIVTRGDTSAAHSDENSGEYEVTPT